MLRTIRAGAAATAAAVLAALLPAASAGADTAEQPPEDHPAQSQAQHAAEVTGERVAIEEFTDEKSRVFAEPDGSFTLEQSPVPQRVRTEQGWAPVDTDLVSDGDGGLRPKAAPAELAFSAGGESTPMVTIGLGAKSVSLDWPGTLPEPTVEGAQATYPDVLPDVDLVLTASADGFSQVLVVDSAEAAANPELAELQLGMDTVGVRMSEDAYGNLEALGDKGGQGVFVAPAPAMWDSSGQEGLSEQRQATTPQAGARLEQVETEVGLDSIRLVPDAGMLSDPDTEFPVFIDPSVSVKRKAWAYVNKQYPGANYFNSSDSDTGVGYEPQYHNTKRAFWRFSVYERTKKATTVINHATLRAKVTHAFGCTDAKFSLWRTRILTKSKARWNNQPEKLGKQDTVNVDKGRPACGGSGVEFDATTAYESAAGADNNSVTYGLYGNENRSNSNHDWRRFAKDPKLVVNYNNKPAQPSTGKMSDSRGGVCSTDADSPRLVNATSLRLRAQVRDYDSKYVGQKVKARFEWQRADGTDLGQADSAASDVDDWPDGSYRSATADGLPEHTPIRYRARAYDTQHWSAWSDWCYLEVDTQAPDTGPEVASPDYPAGDEASGSVGRPGEFTFSANGVEDASAYHYSVNDASCSQTAEPGQPGGDATVLITPREDGPNLVHARTSDAHGNSSACVLVYTFTAAEPAGAVSYFPLDEGQGTSAADAAEQGRTAEAEGAFAWDRGRVGAYDSGSYRLEGTAATLDGARVATAEPVVDTSQAFSVAAWVRLDEKTGNHTVVSQDGQVHSGFMLGYQSSYGLDNWVFKVPSADETGAADWTRAVSDQPAQAGVWTHLLGVYDPASGRARLYIDGVAQEVTETIAEPWQAQGPLVIGGAKFEGEPSDAWPGAVDDVRVWDRVVIGQASDGETGEDAHPETWHLANTPALQGRWQLDEGSGTQVADSSDHGLTGTLEGDPATVWNGAVNEVTLSPGATLDGVDERITTAEPAIRTDRSYSAAAWVRLDEIGVNSTAVSQDGDVHSGFYLGHQNTYDWDQWVFKMAPTDENGAGDWTRALSEDAPQLGAWVHLAATYDHTEATMTLYLDGVAEGTAAVDEAPWNATGPAVIGAARFEEALSDAWNGDIDDVHLYQGVLSPSQITTIRHGDLPPM
ncbi:LamG-like jellyroll fold domain-containing protein [Streptomonospora arabica]|uniref:LamG-like jellyroll fold domain-containing protein n=1 Tax=Streptomonospora arabica TaxID=412417 RepID=A0ABV9SNA9_9ACTN